MRQTQTMSDIKIFTVFFLFSYLFSIAIRLIWVYQFQSVPEFYWNDQLMINTNDGYYFAEGARDILSGHHQANDLSPVFQPLSQLTALLVNILPFSFESIILYMPAFFGALLVLPILLIGFSIGERMAALLAAMLGGIVWSYYNRTMTGYYDTDMLTVVLPTLIVSSMIFATAHQKNRYLIIIPLAIMANQWWYHASGAINLGIFGMMAVYTVVFERHNRYFYKILLFMAIALVGTYFLIKGAVILGLFLLLHYKKIDNERILFILLAIAILGVLVSGGLNPILVQLQSYVFRSEQSVNPDTVLHFYGVAQTVREAGKIPFEVFANRISGHSLVFILSCLGYGLLLYRHRVMLLTLPLVGLGFLSYGFENNTLVLVNIVVIVALAYYIYRFRPKEKINRLTVALILSILSLIVLIIKGISIPGGGLRFTVYAVPIMAISMGYLIIQIGNMIQDKRLRYPLIVIAMVGVLAPNIIHIIGYRVPTVFNKHEVAILDRFKNMTDREDYIMTWWDYGYPIRYYSDVKTLVDGGKHTGDVNFPVSYSLLKPPKASANMARLAVEYTEMAYAHNRSGTYMQMMMNDLNISDSEDLLTMISMDEVPLPVKTRDVYYYLPMRMLDIFPTVALFSNIDLDTGISKPSPFLYQSQQFEQKENLINLGNGVVIDLQKGVINLPNQSVKIKAFVNTQYDNSQKLHVTMNNAHYDGDLYVVYMQSYNRFLVMDESMFASTYVQLFVLEQFDRALFEEVIMTPYAKIFRLLK